MKRDINLKKRSLYVLLATCYPLGWAPFAPGTFGSLLGLLVAYLIHWIQPALSIPEVSGTGFVVYTGIVLVTALLGWWIISRSQSFFPKHDDSRIVIDEVVGQLIAVVYFPITVRSMAVGFLLFRFFDILKPWPISYIDRRVSGAFGVLLDDIVAGIVAAVFLYMFSIYF